MSKNPEVLFYDGYITVNGHRIDLPKPEVKEPELGLPTRMLYGFLSAVGVVTSVVFTGVFAWAMVSGASGVVLPRTVVHVHI